MVKQASLYPAQPHGEIQHLFDNIYLVTGSVGMKLPHPQLGPLTLRFSRNMTIIKQGSELTLINSVRLNEQGLAQLNALGQVKHVIRLAAFHGVDDAFYRERFGAKILSVDAPYFRGSAIPPNSKDIYFTPDEHLAHQQMLPIAGAKYLEIGSGKMNEGLVWLPQQGGTLVSGDSFQNWAETDEYFNWIAKLMMPRMGFIKPHNIGRAWFDIIKPDVAELKHCFDDNVEVLLPSHGKVVFSAAAKHYLQRLSAF